MAGKLAIIVAPLFFSTSGASSCKNRPLDPDWPSVQEWAALNQSTNGALIKSKPIASSCYIDNPFASNVGCDEVQDQWFYSEFHALLPESICYPYWANNSCVPPNDYGYKEGQQCSLGALPEYVLNATSEEQIATAAKWASTRNIRITIKGTGHDLNGRSSGAYSLSIWTRHLHAIQLDANWTHPSNNKKEHAIILGSGNTWGAVLKAAAAAGRTVVSGQDPTVGLGGFIGGGGHGPLSSHYGLAADQVLQATVVTTEGRILVSNDVQNRDLFWAIRGGGPGLYGIVTEYVLRTFPIPQNVVSGILSVSLIPDAGNAAEESWNALATLSSALPDLMDDGISGNGMAVITDANASLTPAMARKVEVSLTLFGYNTTVAEFQSLLRPVQDRLLMNGGNLSISVTLSEPQVFPTYLSFFDYLNAEGSRGGEISLISSRLLGRRELTDLSRDTLKSHLQNITTTMVKGESSALIFGLQGGLGPAGVEASRRGALTPAWRRAHVHLISTGAVIDGSDSTPQNAINAAAAWTEENKEKVWRQWAPDSGAYINEANPYNGNFRHDFYGGNYDRLLEIKDKYDPTASLYTLSGVGSHLWDYSLDTGKLCQKLGNEMITR